jgi:hypothetical protein
MEHGVKTTFTAVMSSLFQADELAPYDFEENCQRKDRYGPEERLLFAILEDAVSCYQVYLLAPKEPERLLFKEAERWIFHDGAEFTSFNNICDTLRIDPAYVRRGLLAWKQWRLQRARQSSTIKRWRTFAHGQRSFGIAVKYKSRWFSSGEQHSRRRL